MERAEVVSDTKLSLRPIALLSAAAFCSAATMRVADPMLPEIAREFATTPGAASVVATAFALAYGLFQVIYGPLGDRFGKYRVIVVGMIMSAAAVSAAAIAGSLGQLAGLRFVAGAAAASVIPLAMAYVGDIVPYEKRQPVLARFLSGQILGVLFGQAAGGVIIEYLSWRQAFLLLGMAFAVIAVTLWIEARSPRVVEVKSSTPLRI
jgi:YNFM family putative membrane transporter